MARGTSAAITSPSRSLGPMACSATHITPRSRSPTSPAAMPSTSIPPAPSSATLSRGSKVHVFAWPKSGSTWDFSDLAAPDIGDPSQEQAYAYAVTDSGRIVGKAKFTNGGPLHAFVTGPQTPPVNQASFDMGTLGGTTSQVWDMNDLSGSVGGAQISSGKMRAFYLQVGAESLQPFDELPPLPGVTRTDYQSEAYGVNSFGEAVGYALDQNLASR